MYPAYSGQTTGCADDVKASDICKFLNTILVAINKANKQGKQASKVKGLQNLASNRKQIKCMAYLHAINCHLNCVQTACKPDATPPYKRPRPANVWLTIFHFACLPAWLSVSLSPCLTVSLSHCLSVSLAVCLYLWLSVCISACLSLSLSLAWCACQALVSYALSTTSPPTNTHARAPPAALVTVLWLSGHVLP